MTRTEHGVLTLQRPAALQEVLEFLEKERDPVASYTLEVPSPRRTNAPTSVIIDEGWLHLEAPLPCRRGGGFPGPRRALGLLKSNVFLPHGITYCIGARSRRLFQIADLPLHEGFTEQSQMPVHVQRLFDTFCSTLKTAPSKVSIRDDVSKAGLQQPLSVDEAAGEAARKLCEETGWAYSERGNGQLAITLDSPGQFIQAAAYLVDDHEFRLATRLEVLPGVSYTSRHAIATFLLTASRMIRMARASTVDAGVACQHRWEVAWDQIPGAKQFHCGLAALSVACQMTVREIRALCDDSVARAYLELRR